MSAKYCFGTRQHQSAPSGVAALAAVCLLALAGCGGTGTTGATAVSSSSPAAASVAVTNKAALAYTGATAGAADPSKTPVVIGFVTQDGGIPAWPETTPSAKAAVDYINAALGGIDKHPLKLKTCLIVSSEEDGQKCGQEMANDPDVRAVVTGQGVVGNASLYSTIGNSKPVFGTPTVPADYNTDNNFDLLGAGYTGLPAMAIYAATTLHAHNVAMVFADEPGGHAAAGLVQQVLDGYGVKLTKVPVPTTSTDVIGAVTAAKAQAADVFLAVVTAPLCIQIAKAKQQLNLKVPVVSTVLCTDKAVAQALGDTPKWTFGEDTESPFLPDASAEAATFVAKLHQYAGAGANIAGFAPHPFAKILTVAKFMNKLGVDAATPKAIADAARSFTGPMWMGGPNLRCGAVANFKAICNTNARIYSYDGNGKWTDATKGSWIDIAKPPAG